jgi:hypothetical protein
MSTNSNGQVSMSTKERKRYESALKNALDYAVKGHTWEKGCVPQEIIDAYEVLCEMKG